MISQWPQTLAVRWVGVSLMAIMATHCASDYHRLTIAGRKVKISQKLPPQAYCRELGEVYASSLGKSDELPVLVRDTRNQLRNLAARKGGNYVTIETNNDTTFSGQLQVVFSGTAYKCVVSASKSFLKGRVKERPSVPRNTKDDAGPSAVPASEVPDTSDYDDPLDR